ncbi:helix-turn-helix domain-containing protein [Nocardia sp. ET3-3]|uniref:Helix-turn-helix domain-containing protein n=1 Tax=Nocardia terrae TaxID=2675851 RepID=A0A7K1V9K3_9NOCA|nr:AraC family transcriptional regulator [Nocardia terrae]MVU83314.1 helix-turn-helix domain-containing protein [Nocardia terrae]
MRFIDLTVGAAEEWSELTNTFVPMEHRYLYTQSWRSRLTCQQSGQYSLLRWDEPEGRIAHRTPGNVKRVPADDFYWLVIPDRSIFGVRWSDDPRSPTPTVCRGADVTARDVAGAAVRVPEGRAMVMGLDQECRLRPGATAYAMQIPRTEIDHALAPAGPMRTFLDLDTGLGHVVNSMIRSAHGERDRLSESEFNAVCDRISELLCLLLTGDLRPQHNHLTETAETVRRYVRENIGTGDVRLPAVATALGWSPRQLRLALQQAGTTYRDLRREESLRAARTMLERPSPPIAEVAARCGFTVTWFSAAFKDRFGETPRDFRKRRQAESADYRLLVKKFRTDFRT